MFRKLFHESMLLERKVPNKQVPNLVDQLRLHLKHLLVGATERVKELQVRALVGVAVVAVAAVVAAVVVVGGGGGSGR